ncbi:MAG: substrate-binding domain-containing protein [Hominisplanchenecus sp.]|nr:substrate-binding domain-containing protein [Lachnospiraceae bacterium]MDY2819091.1 substrate-binding domain-containing protein [Hominisplanchenecus sp.]
MGRVKKISITLVAVLMVVFMVLASTNLVTGEEQEEIKKISVIVENQGESGTDDFKRGIEEAANAKRADIDYIEINGEEETEKILEYIRRERENGVQAMILLTDRQQTVLQYLESGKKEMPLIWVNLDSEDGKVTANITFDTEVMAQELAEKIQKEYGEQAEVVLLTNERDSVKKLSLVLEQEFAGYSFAVTRMKISRNAVRKCLDEGEKKKIFIGCSADVTEQASLFFRENEAVLLGIGYSDKVLQNIREGKIDGVMAYSMYSIGFYAMQSAVTAAEKKDFEPEIQVPCKWITKENMKSEYDFLFPIY